MEDDVLATVVRRAAAVDCERERVAADLDRELGACFHILRYGLGGGPGVGSGWGPRPRGGARGQDPAAAHPRFTTAGLTREREEFAAAFLGVSDSSRIEEPRRDPGDVSGLPPHPVDFPGH